MKNYKLELRAGIAVVAGVGMMIASALVGAPFALAVGVGVASLCLVGFAFLLTGV